MSLSRFTSESYPRDELSLVWQDVLGTVGLRASTSDLSFAHAFAIQRASDGVVVARLAAGPQVISSLGEGSDLPIVLLPIEDGVALNANGSHSIVPAGHLLLLPRLGDWEVTFQRETRAAALSVMLEHFVGRKVAASGMQQVRVLAPDGLASVLARTLEAAAGAQETIGDAEWETVRQGLVDLLMALIGRIGSEAAETGGGGRQAALLYRICQAIERRLDDPDLTPARIASVERISERYLQRLFESTGESFSAYVRERRLQHILADLRNPAEAHRSVSEIAFRHGFNDAAHFSRTFRKRFGRPPSAFRRQTSERATGLANTKGQRGWPRDAIVRLRKQEGMLARGQAAPAARAGGCSRPGERHHYLPVDAGRVHWGYFSRSLAPVVEIASGDTITVETLTQHASDDPERMILGDAGAESVFHWTRQSKGVDRRGAGPMDASIFGRGPGEGFGVHICTGPIAVRDADPGDVLEVRILDIVPRPSRNPAYLGRAFGSSVAAWWGYHYEELLAGPREVVTIYEILATDDEPHARAVYSYGWEPQTDPSGVVHATYDYPGVPVQPGTVRRRHAVLDGIGIPLRPHFGVIAVAPRETGLVDSVPPAYFGGNLDNWRLGRGATIYLPVSVPGALLSVGDPHAAQGDGEVGGTAIECSMTGTFQVVLHKKGDHAGRPFADLTYPLIETETEWILTGFSHPNYLAEFGANSQSEVYSRSSLDLAMKDAFRKVRRFLMNAGEGLSEDEAVALMSAAVDFGVTQVVDGNWGVHAIVSKRIFEKRSEP